MHEEIAGERTVADGHIRNVQDPTRGGEVSPSAGVCAGALAAWSSAWSERNLPLSGVEARLAAGLVWALLDCRPDRYLHKKPWCAKSLQGTLIRGMQLEVSCGHSDHYPVQGRC